MNWSTFLPYLLVMAAVTYFIRMIPLIVFRRNITNRFLRSFLYYIPFAVLAAMTFPEALSCTGNIPASVIATIVALVIAWFKPTTILVAFSACAVAFLGLLIF